MSSDQNPTTPKPLPDFVFMSGKFHDDGDGTVHVSTVFRDGSYLGATNVRALIEWLTAWEALHV